MAVSAVIRHSADRLAVENLRQAIISGEILPGSRLTESALAESLQVSRGTVRFALHKLRDEGLIEQTPYTGWAVTTIAPEDLWELYTLRATLESMACEIAGQRMTDEQLLEFKTAYDELLAACEVSDVSYPLIAERDFNMHKTLVRLSGHRRLMEHYKLVEQQIRIFIATTYHLVSASSSVIEHHRPIAEAILNREVGQACQLLREHAISEGQRLYDYLIKQNAGD